MSETISGIPFWTVTFDEQGDPDPANANVISAIAAAGLTDVIMFSHGWNNSHNDALSLYRQWFGQLVPQLAHAKPGTKVGLVGIFWPSQRWSDEPIPDFAATPAPAGGGGAAGLAPGALGYDYSAALSDADVAGLVATFPAHADDITRMAALLTGPSTVAALNEFKDLLAGLPSAPPSGAGDATDAAADEDGDSPRMLEDDAITLFTRYTNALVNSGARLEASGDGAAGIGDSLGKLWNGAKEALRGTTYFEMKKRAGQVGRTGVAAFISSVAKAIPGGRIHLVGHSFGARLVSCTLLSLPDGASSVKSVTLLQGAFSHFAFSSSLPFAPNRKGALAGRQSRIDGPLTVAYSKYDRAVGTFYPLASMASGDDSAGIADPALFRFGGMGCDGAKGLATTDIAIKGSGPGVTYPSAPQLILNVDASRVVCADTNPSGAHSDIVHPELTWLVLCAGRIVA
jgi:hypothetical protein